MCMTWWTLLLRRASGRRCGGGLCAVRRQAEGRVIEVQNGSGVTYTVPQHIRPSQVDKSCGLFFRVNRICGDSEILVTSGDQTIARFKREHLAPGEMENITLPKVLLDKAGDTLTVSIREVD